MTSKTGSPGFASTSTGRRGLNQRHGERGHIGAAMDRAADPEELDRHLDGVAAIMENHFRYEERQLLTVLGCLELRASVTEVLGPL